MSKYLEFLEEYEKLAQLDPEQAEKLAFEVLAGYDEHGNKHTNTIFNAALGAALGGGAGAYVNKDQLNDMKVVLNEAKQDVTGLPMNKLLPESGKRFYPGRVLPKRLAIGGALTAAGASAIYNLANKKNDNNANIEYGQVTPVTPDMIRQMAANNMEVTASEVEREDGENSRSALALAGIAGIPLGTRFVGGQVGKKIGHVKATDLTKDADKLKKVVDVLPEEVIGSKAKIANKVLGFASETGKRVGEVEGMYTGKRIGTAAGLGISAATLAAYLHNTSPDREVSACDTLEGFYKLASEDFDSAEELAMEILAEIQDAYDDVASAGIAGVAGTAGALGGMSLGEKKYTGSKKDKAKLENLTQRRTDLSDRFTTYRGTEPSQVAIDPAVQAKLRETRKALDENLKITKHEGGDFGNTIAEKLTPKLKADHEKALDEYEAAHNKMTAANEKNIADHATQKQTFLRGLDKLDTDIEDLGKSVTKKGKIGGGVAGAVAGAGIAGATAMALLHKKDEE